jgi:hypothetical protein
MTVKGQDRIRRSPRYPFVELSRAIDQARALWRAVGPNGASVAVAWKSWGYGPRSSGAIQTEAALKQFGLLDVLGRGKHRRLKLSELGIQIMESAPNSPQRGKSIEKAALLPPIHLDLWERWQANLPLGEAQTYLVQHRGFQQKGAKSLVKEYLKTMSFLDSLPSRPARGFRASNEAWVHSPEQNTPRAAKDSDNKDVVDLRFEGNQLVLSARVDRQGIPNLIRILRANQALLGRASNARKKST